MRTHLNPTQAPAQGPIYLCTCQGCYYIYIHKLHRDKLTRKPKSGGMGSLVSKPSQTTAKIGRKFPIREYGDRGPPKLHRVGQEGSNPRSTKCDVISKDGKDSDIISAGFSQRLHKMGVARPNPTISPSSRAPTEVRHTWKGIERKSLPRPTNNWTLTVMETRESLQQLMNKEITSPGQGARRKRRFVDMRTLIDVIKMRNNGVPSEDIEEKFGLQPGITRKIGQVRIVPHV